MDPRHLCYLAFSIAQRSDKANARAAAYFFSASLGDFFPTQPLRIDEVGNCSVVTREALSVPRGIKRPIPRVASRLIKTLETV